MPKFRDVPVGALLANNNGQHVWRKMNDRDNAVSLNVVLMQNNQAGGSTVPGYKARMNGDTDVIYPLTTGTQAQARDSASKRLIELATDFGLMEDGRPVSAPAPAPAPAHPELPFAAF